MFKAGICALDELRSMRAGAGGEPRLPSITLYGEAAAAADGEHMAEEILERFADDQGAYKRTYANRFGAFDGEVRTFLQDYFTAHTTLAVHDMGVSDARTASDFFEFLSAAFPRLDYVASDRGGSIDIVELGKARVSFSSDGRPLEVMWPPFVHNVARRDSIRRYPLNYLHRQLSLSLLAPRAKKLRALGRQTRRLPIWCPRALRLSENDPRFRLTSYDLLTPFEAEPQRNVVRAMNILHGGYFSGAQMTAGAAHVLASLGQGGLFIVGRNEGPASPVAGAIYRKSSSGRFEVAWRAAGPPPDAEPFILAAAMA